MRLVVGLDGGGTKTACLLADEQGRVLAYGLGGPTNINFVARRRATAAVRGAVREALRRSQLRPRRIAVACGSHMCPDWAAAARSVVPVQDTFGADEGGSVKAACMGDGPGVVIIAGTGAAAYAWDRRGRSTYVSGWGSPLGDEGGAYDTAMRGVRAAIYGEDGRGEPTALGDVVREHFHIADLTELCRVFHTERVSRHVVSALCPGIVRAAQESDRVARKILAGSGRELGLAARSAIQRLRLGRCRLDVVVAGGMSRAGRFLMAPLRRQVAQVAPHARVRAANREPVVGCLLLALARLGHTVNDRLRACVDGSMQALGLPDWLGPARSGQT